MLLAVLAGCTAEPVELVPETGPYTLTISATKTNEMTKALISVPGLDTTGIIASVATRLSEMNINILDITQTILDGYFTMMMIVDLDGANLDFEEINRRLQPVRDEKKMTIHMQRMDIFDAMHRI